MPLGQTVLISANPKSGSRNRQDLIHELKQAIEAVGYPCELHTDLSDMSNRAATLSSEGNLRTVVAAGGDGTAAIVSSLIPSHVPLTLFPTGSENLLAKYFAITDNPMRCAQAVRRLHTKMLDTMLVNGKTSLLMASVGFDAEVVRRVHQGRRSHVTRWNYWHSIAGSILGYRWPVLRIVLRDERGSVSEELEGSWVFVFNVPKYAAGLTIIPDAIESDGLLDVGVFAPGGLLRGLLNYWAVARGSHHRMKHWRRFRAASIDIQLQGDSLGHASCQTDGDWASDLPVTISIQPTQRRIVV
jgi:diacylglycerol kinase (ATP)